MPISKNFVLKHVGDEYMIIPLIGGSLNMTKTFNINETGAFIYNNLENGLNIDEIINKMSEEYDVSKDILEKDVKEFVQILKDKGIYNE